MAVESARRELSSWKEIGEYLGITDRSAQKWEKERNLPVHRHPGSSRGKVFAYSDELDEWKRSGSVAPGARRWRLWLAVAGVTAAACACGWFFTRSERPAFARVDRETLVVLDGTGRELWRKAFPGHDETPFYRSVETADLDGDGSLEILFAYRGQGGSYLACLDGTGKERWKFRPGREVREGGATLTNNYGFHSFHAARMGKDGRWKVVVSAHHDPHSAAQVALLDASGRLLREYWHPGHLNQLAVGDVDGTGRAGIYLVGTNNPEGSATLVVLDPDTFDGSAANSRGQPHFANMAVSPEIARVLFPRTDLNRQCCTFSSGTRVVLHRESVEVHVDENPFAAKRPVTLIYHLSRDLRILRAAYSDFYVSLHRELEKEGKLRPLQSEAASGLLSGRLIRSRR